MSKDTISFFLPTRKGSERVKNKNTRPFANIEGGLVENKLKQLLATKHIDEIIFSSNDETCMDIAAKFRFDNRLKIIPRPEELCLSSTNLQDLICYVPTITDAEHIIWGHVTTPLADASVYDNAILEYLKRIHEGYDSLISVTELKNFLLDVHGKMIKNTTNIPWPRTQDLESLYEINHVLFIASRSIYEVLKNRVGNNPYLFCMDKLHSYDIDWEDDFKIAEAIWYNLNK